MNSAQYWVPIAALDLEGIKVKLMHKESGEGWSRAYVDALESEYRRFMYLVKMYPDDQIAPLFDVDVFWHYHILDTRKYAVDCEQIFGYFLHHCPSSGMQSEDEQVFHDRSSARMQELYEATFGESCVRQQEGKAVKASSAKSAWCTPAVAQAAWCSPASPNIAWCSPASPNIAWCSPAVQNTAWCSPVVVKINKPKPAASNDRMWS